uniref:Cell division control protein 6 homolog n=1 Tax=Anas platyrhynchos TaxID=8839 RepID=A0A8B9TWU5_ANAPL
MPIPPPPPPPGPPPPPTFSQANTEPPKLSREEQRGRGALLQDICKGTKLRKVTQINDRSAPLLEKPKGGGGGVSGPIQPKGGLFQGGVPKLRPVGAKDTSESSTKQTLQVPGSRVAAPRPPVPSTPTPPSSSRPPPQDDADGSRGSPPELPRTQRPSLPDLSRPNAASTPSGGMKHSSSAPPPAPPRPPQRPHPQNFFLQPRKTLTPHPGSTPPPPATTTTTTRDGPPPAPPPAKPPPSPVNLRTGAPGGQTLAAAPPPPPPPPYRQPPGVPNGPPSPVAEAAPELPQRHNSLHRKPPGPLRGLAPPPPNSAASPALQSSRPPPPARDPPSRGAAPPPPPPLLRNGGRDAPPPPPPPYRVHGPADPPGRGKPPPPPTRTPAGPPPPPPPLRNGHRDSIRAFLGEYRCLGTNWGGLGGLGGVLGAAPSPFGFILPPPFLFFFCPPPHFFPQTTSSPSTPSTPSRISRPPRSTNSSRGFTPAKPTESPPAMPSTRSRSQPTIGFPRRRSARCLAAPPAKPPPAKTLQDDPDRDPPAPNLSPLPKNPPEPGSAPPAPLSPRCQALPLSPRKRLGDDNLCNVPHTLPCSPAKRSKENRGRRLLFGDPAASPGKTSPPEKPPNTPTKLSPPEKSPSPPVPPTPHRGQETPQSSGRSGDPVRTRLFRPEGSCYQQAKRALHAAVPERLQGREREVGAIRKFLGEHLPARRPGSLYISGPPGTGKTACLSCVLRDCQQDELAGSRVLVLNCMELSSPHAVFPAVAQRLGVPGAGREALRGLEKELTAPGPMLLLVLDELDQLESKGQDVLYTIFEWPRLPRSRLVLIGVANALDLTERSLARLHARLAPGPPRLLHFPPYSRQQLAAILQERLARGGAEAVLDPPALQFCARKVSAVSGDARKALDVCRRAVEMVELDVRTQTLLKPPPGCDPPSAPSPVPVRVGLPHVSRVLSEVFGDRMTAGGGRGAPDTFPLQQKVLVCSLLLLARHLRAREVTLGKLHDAYSRVCRRQQLCAVDQAECLALVTLLEARGVLQIKRAKEARLAKVSLKIEEEEARHALQDAALVGSILARGLL